MKKSNSIIDRFDKLLRRALNLIDEVVNEGYQPGDSDLEVLCNAAVRIRANWLALEAQPHGKPSPVRRAKTRVRAKRGKMAATPRPNRPFLVPYS